jgi:mitotic spindle assembly checkpoint protein MAD2
MDHAKIMSPSGIPEALANVPTPAKGGRATNVITLRGSVDTVVEFFGFAINSILYQRGVYSPESFSQVTKYGLKILVSQDRDVQAFIGEVLEQVKGWMVDTKVRKLVVVISSSLTGETLERWTFDVQVNEQAAAAGAVQRTQDELVRQQKDIQAIISPDHCLSDLLAFAR